MEVVGNRASGRFVRLLRIFRFSVRGRMVDALRYGLLERGLTRSTDTLPAVTGPWSGIVGFAGNNTYSQVVRTNTSGQVGKRASAATTTIYIARSVGPIWRLGC